jgi:hypothetical protein
MGPAELRTALRSAGIVTRADLLSSGVTSVAIDGAIRHGTLIRLGQGVYGRAPVIRQVRREPEGDYLLRVAVALAMAGPDTVASHQSAARLLGIAVTAKPTTDVTVTGPPDLGRHNRPGTHRFNATMPAGHVTAIRGLPITTAARTVIDLARTLDFRTAVAAADGALHRRLTSKAELRSVLAELPRRRGLANAKDVVQFADERAESPLESIARVVIRDCGLPAPELQVWLGGIEEPVARVDFYWRRYRTAAEVDGAAKYGQDPGRAAHQLRRDALLRAEGFEVVHLTWQDVNSAPEDVGTLIRLAFRRQVASGAVPGAQRAS